MAETREEAVRSVTRAFGDQPFAWGRLDCCQLARAVFEALRGYDPAPGLIYTTKEEADTLIEAYGGLAGLFTYILGEPVDPNETSTADVLLLKLPGVGEIAGVRVPDGALVPLKVGLYRAPLRYALEGWRI
jgi:hypothetical protein